MAEQPSPVGMLERSLSELRNDVRAGFKASEGRDRDVHARIDELTKALNEHAHGPGQNGAKNGGVTVRIGTEALKSLVPGLGGGGVIVGILKLTGVI